MSTSSDDSCIIPDRAAGIKNTKIAYKNILGERDEEISALQSEFDRISVDVEKYNIYMDKCKEYENILEAFRENKDNQRDAAEAVDAILMATLDMKQYLTNPIPKRTPLNTLSPVKNALKDSKALASKEAREFETYALKTGYCPN